MPIEARVEKDSINSVGIRLTTFIVKFPRYILPQFNTHRALSRNAASSRAIPVEKSIQKIQEETVYPIWSYNQKGMQGKISTDKEWIARQNERVNRIRDFTISVVQEMIDDGVHKQNANRYLEPLSWVTLVVTGTDWENFFTLRIHQDAQDEICDVARLMYMAKEESIPQPLKYGEWHRPFIQPDEVGDDETLNKISVARCARVSYLTHDGKRDVEKDLELYDRLVGQVPRHGSPAEHVAMALNSDERHGNIRGFIQHRKLIPDENFTVFHFPEDMI